MVSSMSKRVLVLLAHPALEHSRVHRRLIAPLAGLEGVELRDLYELYPDFDIDVKAEQAALVAADVVVFEHPLYWYSCPALLKQWLDLVLAHGWAYGANATALAGKLAMNAISTGGPQSAYQAEGYNKYTIDEFLRPFERTAHLCGMRYLPPFVAHGSHSLQADAIDALAGDYLRLITALRDEPVERDGTNQNESRKADSRTDAQEVQ